MSLFEKLSDKEKNIIYDYIYKHGARSGCSQPIAKLDHILRYWDAAKSEYLYDIFGKEFIISKKINFEKSHDQLAEEINENVTSRWGKSSESIKFFISEWNKLIEVFSNRDVRWALIQLIADRTLASNRYDGKSIDIPLPKDKKYKLLPGAKASKAISKIAKAYDIPNAEEFRIAVSQVLNQKTVSGEFCLSIHPLDYMTMSDNDCGWGSCMSWYDHGDFRQGTVEMMNSPMVIVAYLKSSTDYCISKIDSVYWNSKRWRELFIVTPEVIAAVKGYPYWNRNLEKSIINWLKELTENSGIEGFGPYEDEIKSYVEHDHIILNKECDVIASINFRTDLMYNDMYDVHKLITCQDYDRIPSKINYSGESECMSCGEKLYNYETEADLFCPDCDPVYRCNECGDWHNYDDLIEVNGRLYCEYCYDTYILNCSCCGEPYHEDEMNIIYLARDKDTIYRDKSVYLDDDCLFDGQFFNKDKLNYKTVRNFHSINYILIEDLTDDGLRAFEFNNLEEALNYNTDYCW